MLMEIISCFYVHLSRLKKMEISHNEGLIAW